MDEKRLRDAVKHPEKLGPLGRKPAYAGEHQSEPADEDDPIQEQAVIADREQLTTTD